MLEDEIGGRGEDGGRLNERRKGWQTRKSADI